MKIFSVLVQVLEVAELLDMGRISRLAGRGPATRLTPNSETNHIDRAGLGQTAGISGLKSRLIVVALSWTKQHVEVPFID